MNGELAALGAAVSWTVSAILYRKALQRANPVSANVVRLSCTSAILLAFLVVTGRWSTMAGLPLSVVGLAGVSGVIGLGLGDTLYMTSLKWIGVSRAVPLTCTYPLFGLLWAILLSQESVTLSVALGTVIIVLGIWFLSYEEKASETGLQRKVLMKGVALALATALLWSVSISMMDLAVQNTPDMDHALAVNTLRASAVALFLLVLSPVIDRNRSFLKLGRKTILTLIMGGLVALGVGWFFLAYSFTVTDASRAIPISSTTPLFSALVGAVLLHERVSRRNVAGSMMVVAGIFLVFLGW